MFRYLSLSLVTSIDDDDDDDVVVFMMPLMMIMIFNLHFVCLSVSLITNIYLSTYLMQTSSHRYYTSVVVVT